MKKSLLENVKNILEIISDKKIYRKVLIVLGIFVIIGTTYKLMLPAITASNLICQKEQKTFVALIHFVKPSDFRPRISP